MKTSTWQTAADESLGARVQRVCRHWLQRFEISGASSENVVLRVRGGERAEDLTSEDECGSVSSYSLRPMVENEMYCRSHRTFAELFELLTKPVLQVNVQRKTSPRGLVERFVEQTLTVRNLDE